MPTAWLPYDSNELPLSGTSFLCSRIILCSQGIIMPPLYTIFSCSYWNYRSASFWSFTRCQKHSGQYSQRDPDTQLPTEHRSQVPTPLQYFLEAELVGFWGSLGEQDPATSSAIGDKQIDRCYSFSGTSASRGLTLFKQSNFKIHDLAEGRRGRQPLLSD